MQNTGKAYEHILLENTPYGVAFNIPHYGKGEYVD